MPFRAIAIVVLCLAARGTGYGATPTFHGLGDLPGGRHDSGALDVSADGSVVVGYAYTAGGERAFRWTAAGGMQNLGVVTGRAAQSRANAVSADGTTVVGYSGLTVVDSTVTNAEAFRWTQSTGMVGLGSLAGPGASSSALGVDGDGSFVVGATESSSDWKGFGWDPASGMVDIGSPRGFAGFSVAYDVTPDRSAMIFQAGSGPEARSWRWTDGAGGVNLGIAPDGDLALAQAISADGGTVVGYTHGSGTRRAFRWTAERGVEILAPASRFGPFDIAAARDVSADGSVIVGESQGATRRGGAFVWLSGVGMLPVRAVLIELGLEQAIAGWTIDGALGVSDDGTTLVGVGVNPAGDYEAWRAVIPEPATSGLLLAAGAVAATRRLGRRRARV